METNKKTFWDHIINNTPFDLYIVTPLTACVKYIQVTARWDTANHIISFHKGDNDILSRNRRMAFTFQDLQTDTLKGPDIVYTLNPNQIEKSYIDFRKADIEHYQNAKKELQRRIGDCEKEILRLQELIKQPNIKIDIRK